MWLPRLLRNALESLESAQKLSSDVDRLRAAVEALEAIQLQRDLQWTETKDQISRHLKRVAALKNAGSDKDDRADLVAAVLARKFPSQGG